MVQCSPPNIGPKFTLHSFYGRITLPIFKNISKDSLMQIFHTTEAFSFVYFVQQASLYFGCNVPFDSFLFLLYYLH